MFGLFFRLISKTNMMKTINLSIVLLVFLVTFSCQKEDSKVAISNLSIDDCEQNASNKGFVFREDGEKWLNGGANDSWHFDITGWSLRECQLNYGLGREHFKALIQPQYEKASEQSNSEFAAHHLHQQ